MNPSSSGRADEDRLTRTLVQILAKQRMLREHSPRLRTLVLGSSYGEHGFDPAFCPDSFNLCLRLLDMRHACALYETVAPACPRLQSVVVFHAIGSGSNFSEHARNMGEVCAALEEVFGLGLRYRTPHLLALLEQVRGRAVGLPEDLQGYAGFQPHLLKELPRDLASAATRVAQHLRLSKRTDGNLSLLRILLLARRRGHRVIVVTPPARSDYVKLALEPGRRLLHDLSRMLFRDPHGCPVQWINGFDSGEFDDGDFVDCDHLSPEGAGTMRLSLRISQAVAPGGGGAGPLAI